MDSNENGVDYFYYYDQFCFATNNDLNAKLYTIYSYSYWTDNFNPEYDNQTSRHFNFIDDCTI